MADFCKQCSEDLFSEDFKELAGITSAGSWEKGLSAVVICEGCGPIQVDPEGRCVSIDCLGRHAGISSGMREGIARAKREERSVEMRSLIACVTPNGRTDGHGTYVEWIDGVECCMFCKERLSPQEVSL